jgi:hypothetical protein
MRRLRRHLAPALLIAALAATLVFAATAAAEVRIGEGTSPEQAALPGEADLLKGSLEYDSATGTATVAITTRQAQETTPEADRPEIQYLVALVNVNFTCTREGFEAASKKAAEEKTEPGLTYPIYELYSANKPFSQPPPGQSQAQAYGAFIGSKKETEGEPKPENFVAGTKVVSGTTATVGATFSKAANQPFNCAEVIALDLNEGGEPDVIVFPLTTRPEPPAPPVPPAPPAPQPAREVKPSGPAPGVLSLARAKPLRLPAGKWTTVKLKITNSGGTAIPQGSLRVTAPKGVVVKAGRQRLPALLPGESWNVSARVELTEGAKARSTVALTASAGGLTATGSLVLRLKG